MKTFSGRREIHERGVLGENVHCLIEKQILYALRCRYSLKCHRNSLLNFILTISLRETNLKWRTMLWRPEKFNTIIFTKLLLILVFFCCEDAIKMTGCFVLGSYPQTQVFVSTFLSKFCHFLDDEVGTVLERWKVSIAANAVLCCNLLACWITNPETFLYANTYTKRFNFFLFLLYVYMATYENIISSLK